MQLLTAKNRTKKTCVFLQSPNLPPPHHLLLSLRNWGQSQWTHHSLRLWSVVIRVVEVGGPTNILLHTLREKNIENLHNIKSHSNGSQSVKPDSSFKNVIISKSSETKCKTKTTDFSFSTPSPPQSLKNLKRWNEPLKVPSAGTLSIPRVGTGVITEVPLKSYTTSPDGWLLLPASAGWWPGGGVGPCWSWGCVGTCAVNPWGRCRGYGWDSALMGRITFPLKQIRLWVTTCSDTKLWWHRVCTEKSFQNSRTFHKRFHKTWHDARNLVQKNNMMACNYSAHPVKGQNIYCSRRTLSVKTDRKCIFLWFHTAFFSLFFLIYCSVLENAVSDWSADSFSLALWRPQNSHFHRLLALKRLSHFPQTFKDCTNPPRGRVREPQKIPQ